MFRKPEKASKSREDGAAGKREHCPATVTEDRVKECKRLDSKEDIKDHNKSRNVRHKVKRQAAGVSERSTGICGE